MTPAVIAFCHGPDVMHDLMWLLQAHGQCRKGRVQPSFGAKSATQPLCATSRIAAPKRHAVRGGIAAHAVAGNQPPPASLDEELPETDAAREILDEIAAEDARAAEQSKGKEPVYDLFPRSEVGRLSVKEQRARLAKLTGRPLRAARASRRPSRRSAEILGGQGWPWKLSSALILSNWQNPFLHRSAYLINAQR